MGRVAAIAIDAAEWWYVERLIDAGKLPHLARLRALSAEWELRSPVPYRSELVWARFLTGREPIDEKDWATAITFEPRTYEVGSNTATNGTPFFALGPGTKVLALDLIHSAPADGVDGVQVVAWGSHSPQWPRSSRPVGVLTEIDRTFGTNPAFGNDFSFGWHDPGYIDALAAACRVGGQRRADVCLRLLEEHPDWDLLIVCLSEFHSLGHHTWFGVDERHPLHARASTSAQAARVLEEGLVAVDAAVGRLVEAVGEDTSIVLFALHGFEPADDAVATVLAPELFQRLHLGARAGLIKCPDPVDWRNAGCPPVVPRPEDRIESWFADIFADTLKQRARRRLRSLLSDAAFERARRAAGRPATARPADLSRATPPEATTITPEVLAKFREPPRDQVAYWYRKFWPRMPYFALPSFADGHIRVNLRGREHAGMVEKDDYKRALDEIEHVLMSCVDARTGSPIVGDLVRMRAADPMDPCGPCDDLLVIWAGAPDALEHPTVGTIGPVPHLRTAIHSRNGFALVASPAVTPGRRGVRPSADLTPTVLSLLDRPGRPGGRGRPLHEPP